MHHATIGFSPHYTRNGYDKKGYAKSPCHRISGRKKKEEKEEKRIKKKRSQK